MRTRRVPLLLAAGVCLAVAVAAWLLSATHAGETEMPEGELRGGNRLGFHAPASPSSAEPGGLGSGVPADRLPQPLSAAGVTPHAPEMRRISGRIVRASDGTPIDGVTVSRSISGKMSEAPRHAFAKSRAPDGAFDALDVPDDERTLWVILSDDWPRHQQRFDLPDVAGDLGGQLITYDSGFRLRVIVRDLRGTPLSGASVFLSKQEPVTTNAAGVVEIVDVAPSASEPSFVCTAQAAMHAWQVQAVELPRDVTQIVVVEFALPGAGTIEGTVTDIAGQPVPSTRVSIAASSPPLYHADDAARFESVTDRYGAYRIEHVPAGTHVVRVEPAVPYTESDLLAQQEKVTEDLFDDPDPGSPPARHLEEAAKGIQAVLEEVASVARRGLGSTYVPRVEISCGETTHLDPVLSGGQSIAGRVVDARGAPRTATVEVQRVIDLHDTGRAGGMDRLELEQESIRTGHDGRFECDHLPAGEYVFRAQADESAHMLPAEATVLVALGERPAELTLALADGVALRGRVTGIDDKPLAEVRVHAAPVTPSTREPAASGTTAVDGWFVLEGLSSGSHDVTLQRDGFVPQRVRLSPDDPPRTFVLRPAVALHALVKDARTNEPVTRFALAVLGAAIPARAWEQDYPLGRIYVDGLTDAPQSLTITAPGYQPLTLHDLRPTSTSAIAPLRILLQPQP